MAKDAFLREPMTTVSQLFAVFDCGHYVVPHHDKRALLAKNGLQTCHTGRFQSGGQTVIIGGLRGPPDTKKKNRVPLASRHFKFPASLSPHEGDVTCVVRLPA
jgi:hypothetical protein